MLTKWWKLELTLATNFGSHAQMVTKFGGQILATKFGFVPDCLVQDCSNSIAHAPELLQSYTKPSKYCKPSLCGNRVFCVKRAITVHAET